MFYFVILIVGTAGLFFLDRENTVRHSKAMWLPTAWIAFIGSRPPSVWLSMTGATRLGQSFTVDTTLEGNSTDAFIFTTIVALGIMVLLRRKRQTLVLLKGSGPVLAFFAYCLISTLWSPFPGVAFKRWIKAAGDLIIGLVIVTEAEPTSALRRLFSRVCLLLMPASIYLIRYSDLGRGYDPDGNIANVGVTTNKNTLGLITFVLALGAFWNFLALLRTRDQPNRGRHLLAGGAILGLTLIVLHQARSATSIACFVVGGAIITMAAVPAVTRRPGRINAILLTIVIVSAVGKIIGADELVFSALGRNSDLTGRTDIWKTIAPFAGNPLVGMGFESFWNAINPTLRRLPNQFLYANLNSAHNGYFEVYLNLGLLGLVLLAAVLIGAYRRAAGAFDLEPEIGGLVLAYVLTNGIYSLTEAGFRMLTPTWIFLLLSFVFATGVRVRAKKEPSPKLQGPRGPALSPRLEMRPIIPSRAATF